MKILQSSIFTLVLLFSAFGLNAQCFSEQTFTSPGQSTYTVPGTAADTYVIEIEAKGADGGDFLWGGNPQTDGGEGATMKASFVIPGGSDLLVVVGTSGFDAPGSPGGGGGGGGTAVILDNADVLIAAGAGGGGGQGASNTGQGGQANTNSPAIGGLGLGSSGGGGFNAPGGDGPASTGGGAGTLAGQGTGGNGGVTAGDGGAGFGGGGGGSGTVGGGGGGYKGGDGSDGSADLNGKGGDSYINTLFTGTVIFNSPGADGGGSNNNGSVIITCIPQGSVEISLVSAVDVLCFGGFTGAIEVEATGGLAPYQFSLNGGTYGDSPIFTGLAAGDYTVTVQDGAGSTDMIMVTLSAPPELIAEEVIVVDNVCFGGTDGSIEVIASGGTSASGTYLYSINNGPAQNSGLFINLPSGVYVITIFDDNFCTAQEFVTISSADDLELILVSKSDVTCFGMNDGAIAVAAFGGTGIYMYSIDDEPFGDSSQFFDLAGGTYIIRVMDAEGCIEELIVFINEPDEVQFDVTVTDVTCYGGDDGVIEVVDVTGTAPFTYKLNDGEAVSDPIFNGLSAGEYIVAVIDSSGCEYVADAEVLNADSLTLTVTIVSEVQCGGDSTGAVLLELVGGMSPINYNLNQNENTTGSFENLAAGAYTASATDANGCISEIQFEIQESATFEIGTVVVTFVSCFGGSDGSIMITVPGAIEPIQYSIDGINFQDSPLFSDLTEGAYEISVIDSTGCVNSALASVGTPPELQIDYLNIQNVSCYGDATGSVAVSLTGGNIPYTVNGIPLMTASDTSTIMDLSAGDHILTIIDGNGCELIDTVTITQNDSLVLFVSTFEGDKCGPENTGSVDLNAVGGYAPLTITLNGETDAEGVFDSLAAGDYTATVVDDLGCMTSLDFNIPQLDGLQLDSLTIGDVSCHGEADGFVEFFISNANGMVSIVMDDVVYTESLITDLSGGTYNFTVEDEEGCFLDIEVIIHEPDPLTIEVTDANLGEGYITVTSNGGTLPHRYSIDNKVTYQESSTFTNLGHGHYTIIVTDANNCESEVTYSLVGVDNLDFNDLKIYPNPASNILHLEYEGGYSDLSIDLINRLGQIVKSFDVEEVHNNSKSLDLDVNGIVGGSYILRLRQGDKVGYYQVVIVE